MLHQLLRALPEARGIVFGLGSRTRITLFQSHPERPQWVDSGRLGELRDPRVDRRHCESRDLVLAASVLVRTDEGPMAALRMLMEADVRAQMAHGILIAFGLRTLPDLSDGPETIPEFMFESQSVEIDWEKSVVAGLGRRFEGVTITAPLSFQGPQIDALAEPVDQTKPKSRGGRKSNYPQARAVLKELYAEHPGYRSLSAARLHDAFNTRYREIHVPAGEKSPVISERALRDYVARFRQESAETDGN